MLLLVCLPVVNSHQGWQVSANVGLNRFKLIWQKPVSVSVYQCNVFTHVHCRMLCAKIAADEC